MFDEIFMCEVIVFVCVNVEVGGCLFGVVLVCDGWVLVCGVNQIYEIYDFSVYVELQVICQVSQVFGSLCLDGCVIYVSGYFCLMCLVVMYFCGIQVVWFVYFNEDGEVFGLFMVMFYVEMVCLLQW